MTTPRATYTGRNGLWHGAIKVGAKVVWTCPHNHRNRDHGSHINGRAASACSASALRYALMTDEELAAKRAEIEQCNRHAFSSMSPVRPMQIDFELSVRDEIRRAIGA